MSKYRLGVIGCGRPWKTEGSTGFGMSRQHVKGFIQSGEVEVAALADIREDNARLFQKDIAGEKIYTDYHEMLAKEKLDIVTIATWPHLHAEMVLAAAATAGIKAIHCEKPMALTYGDAVKMAETCAQRGIQLTFNHQRRFLEPFRKAKQLICSGALGKLVRLESKCANLYDWGTHWFDMMNFLNDDQPAEWVIGQMELRGNRRIFDAPIEGQGLCHFKFRNDVRGIMITGFEANWGCEIRAVGTEGQLELGASNEVPLRTWLKGQTQWEKVETAEGLHGDQAVWKGAMDVVSCLKTGREPELSARKALQATQLIFATYESSRRRGRVDLPLQIEDSPLADMLASQRA